jgi:FixJ family two-component response regulator
MMPEMNGPELASELASARPGVPVVFMSGYAGDAIERSGLTLAQVALLEKPSTPQQVLDAVRTALGTEGE